MLIAKIRAFNIIVVALVGALWTAPERKKSAYSEFRRVRDCDPEFDWNCYPEDDEAANNMPLDQGTKVFVADDDESGREGYIVMRKGGEGSGSALYIAVFPGELLETINYRSANVTLSAADRPEVVFAVYPRPDMDAMLDKARRRFGGQGGLNMGDDGGGARNRDNSPSPPRRRKPRGEGVLATWVTVFLDLWGLRWTRRRIGTSAALLVAGYRGWRWFGFKDKLFYYWDLWRDEIIGLCEEFGFDAEWREWLWNYLWDRETWKAAGFGLFMLILLYLFFTDCDLSLEGLLRRFCGGGDDDDSASGQNAALRAVLEENQRLTRRMRALEQEAEKKQAGPDCVVLGMDVAAPLDRLRARLEEHKRIALEDAGRCPAAPRPKKDDEVDDTPTTEEDVAILVKKLEREMVNPSEKFVSALKQYKALDDWPMPSGAKQRLAPVFLAETVYKGGSTAQRWWLSFMRDHGLMECPAAKDGLSAAIALDYLLLVDNADIINSTAAETLARELYGLVRCFENVHCKDDWRQPKGVKQWASKAQWNLRDRYSIRALAGGKPRVAGADAEVRKSMETEALFEKYLQKSTSGGGDGANVIVAVQGSDGGAAAVVT